MPKSFGREVLISFERVRGARLGRPRRVAQMRLPPESAAVHGLNATVALNRADP